MVCSEIKTRATTHVNKVQIGKAGCHSRPLRQINGNVKLQNIANHLTFNNQENLCDFKLAVPCIPSPPNKRNEGNCQSSHIQKKKDEKSLKSILSVHLKRLNMNQLQSLFHGMKQFFSPRDMYSVKHSSTTKSNGPFINWSSDRIVNNYGSNEIRKNVQGSDRKCCLVNKNKQRSIKRSKSSPGTCKLTLERIDTKICFMENLKLQPKVKVNVHKMHELLLLRKYNIKRCHIVIFRMRPK